MANFNTNQTRHFYVAKAIDSSVATPGDINLGTTATGEFFFTYRNADGLLTRSDLIRANSVRSLKKAVAADMDIKLMASTITLASSVDLSNNIGKAFNLVINLRQFMSYDASDSIAFTATVVADSTNTADDADFYTALAKAIALAMPKLPEAPFKIFLDGNEVTKNTSDSDLSSYGASADSVVLVPAPQKWIRGKMSNEPLELDIVSSLRSSNTEDIAWADIDVAPSEITDNEVISSSYKIADLEYFALGERGDVYRGSFWPNNYEPTYMVDVAKQYDMVSIEYYWQGGAENVQKSPRLLEIACEISGSGSQASSVAEDIISAVEAVIAGGTASGSGA